MVLDYLGMMSVKTDFVIVEVAIFDSFLNYYFSEKICVYYNILPKKELEGLLLGQM